MALLSALFGTGWSPASLPSDPPSDRQLIEAFAEVHPTPAAGPVKVTPPHLHLYLDSSKSMQGFVASPSSRFTDVLEHLLDDAASAGFIVDTSSFDGTVHDLGRMNSRDLLEGGFYNGLQTSFPRLFERIASERGHGTISVVVSDLVQSGSTGDQLALSAAFQQITRSNPEIELLAYRSSFYGTYYVEGRRAAHSHFRLTLNGTRREFSRPFYVLIIADDAESLAHVRHYLRPQVDELSGQRLPLVFDATVPVFTVETTRFAPFPGDPPTVWNIFEPERPLTGPRPGPPRFRLSFLEIATPERETSTIRLQLSVKNPPNEGALRSPQDLRLDFQRVSWGKGWRSKVEPAEVAWEAEYPKDRLKLALTLPRPKPFSWDAYKLRLSPGPGNLLTPSWAPDWSTVDDSSASAGWRTLKLDVFIETMIRAIKEKVVLSEQYVLLGRGE